MAQEGELILTLWLNLVYKLRLICLKDEHQVVH